ncbi:MAG TPA: AarF/UbiB family protein [Acidimicrobiales bacterium]|nr:AarF/UbiB family protein [Acidimicrobiales bacterium]
MTFPSAASVPEESLPRVRPRRLPTPRTSELVGRGAQIGTVVARHFGPLALRQLRHPRQGLLAPEAIARPMRLVYEELGGTFIKFGQVIASSPGLFGEEVSDEFRSTLDTGPPVPFAEVRRVVEDTLGMDLEEAYAEFSRDPVGRASIAVVHRARLHDGREVAVKVIRPGIEHLVATDIDLMAPLFELLAKQTGDQMAGSTLQLLDGFRTQIGEEMDLRNEARSMAHFRRLNAEVDLPLIVVPEPYPELSGQNVLTMEFLDGVPIDDLARVAELGYDPAPLVEQVVRAFFVTVVRWGTFHGDIHAGNMLLLRDGRIGIIDWGIVGRLDHETHCFFLQLLSAVLGDEAAWTDITRHLVKTYGPALQEAVAMDEEQLSAFIRDLITPILTKPFGEVSLATLMQATEAQVARAQGYEARQRSLGSILRRLRHQRRIRKMADEAGGLETDFDRGNFLLGKQLMYFERYGKLFLADVPILNDRAFFESLLAGAEAQALGRAGPPTLAPPEPAPGPGG